MPARHFWITSLALLLLASASPREADAQRYTIRSSIADSAGLMGPSEASALDLTQAWKESVALARGLSSLADIALFVDTETPLKYMELTVPKADQAAASPAGDDAATAATAATDMPPVDESQVMMRLEFGTVGDSGRIIDETEANRLADNEMRRLKRRGYDVKKATRTVPRILLYSLTEEGTLQRRNAETGRLDWQIGIGKPGIGFGELGISNKNVLVTNGSNMIQVDAESGRVVREVVLKTPPSFGASCVANYGIVHSVRGAIDIFNLSDVLEEPYHERVRGRANARPISAPGSFKIAWPTNEGFVYVTELSGQPSTVFRLDTDGVVTGSVAAGPDDKFYFGTDRGQVYGMQANASGDVLWSESLGIAVISDPILLNNRLFVLTEFGELYCLDARNGNRLWDNTARNVGRLYAAFEGHLFCEDSAGRFTVVNADDGSTVATPAQFQPTKVVVNAQTDRLYFVGQSGLVQCMRPVGRPLPTLIAGESTEEAKPEDADEKVEEEKMVQAKPKPEVKDPFATGGDDPFGTKGDDPFGAGGNDPFGGGDDPFGGGGDPFGGDPFN